MGWLPYGVALPTEKLQRVHTTCDRLKRDSVGARGRQSPFAGPTRSPALSTLTSLHTLRAHRRSGGARLTSHCEVSVWRSSGPPSVQESHARVCPHYSRGHEPPRCVTPPRLVAGPRQPPRCELAGLVPQLVGGAWAAVLL